MANSCCSITEHVSFCRPENTGFEKCEPCRKITTSSNRTVFCDVKGQGCSGASLGEECAPCCEVITTQTHTDYRTIDKGTEFEKEDKIKKCAPCREITTKTKTTVYCDLEENEENNQEKCNPCCEVINTTQRIDYLSKNDGKSIEKCVPCIKATKSGDRVVYCNGEEASDLGCTPCCDVITTKKRVNYDPREGSNSKKVIKKGVPCYEVTSCCKTTLYCDQDENQIRDATFHKNCKPCCRDEIVQKRISYTPNATGFDEPNLDVLRLKCC